MANREIFQAWAFNGLVQPIQHISAPRRPGGHKREGSLGTVSNFLREKVSQDFWRPHCHIAKFSKSLCKTLFPEILHAFLPVSLQNILLSSLERTVN